MDNPDYPPPYSSRGGDKEKKTEVVAKDYGRKPYLSKSYPEMMGRTTTRAILDQVLQKKSQFEKPYIAEEDYDRTQEVLQKEKAAVSWQPLLSVQLVIL